MIEGVKLLLLEKLDAGTMAAKADHVIAMDSVGCGIGEVVFYVTGSSARMTDICKGRPTDASIIAIVDSIDKDGAYVYERSSES